MERGLFRADFEKVLAVIDGGGFLLWMQEGDGGEGRGGEKASHD